MSHFHAPEHPDDKHCLNCGALANHKFCPNCGQSTREVRVSVKSLLQEAFGTVFNLDSRVMRSIRPLFFQPGQLAVYFIEGKRMNYVPPIRLYLICSLVFFLSLSYITTQSALEDANPTPVTFVQDGDGGVNMQFGNAARQAHLEREEAKKREEGKQDSEPEDKAPENQVKVDEEETPSTTPVTKVPLTSAEALEVTQEVQEELKKKGIDTGPGNWGYQPSKWKGKDVNVEELTWWESVEYRLEKNTDKLQGKTTAEILPVFIPAMFKALSRGLIVFMPLFAFFLKLLYVRRDPYYVDHLIFALHFHSFLYIYFSALAWWNYLVDANLFFVLLFATTLIPLLYLYKSMRRIYGQGRIKTLAKVSILCGLYFLCMIALASYSATAALLAMG